MVNCFVQPAIDPGLGWPQGLDAALARAVRTMSMGGGVGYDFSPVPPRTPARVGRRMRRHRPLRPGLPGPGHAGQAPAGAQMGVLACDHPDLPAFLHAKAGRRRWPTLNLSVALSDRFLRAVENDEAWTSMPARRRADRHHSEACVATMEHGPMPAGAAAVGGADRRGLPGR